MKSPEASPTLIMNEQVNAMWAAGKDILHLGFGESRFPVHPALSRALQENASQRSYLPSLGLPELRDAMAKYYSEKHGSTFSANQVIVGVGSKSLLFAMIQSIDGDLLLPKPSWVSYSSIAKLTGRSVHRFLLDAEKEYCLNVDLLDSAYAEAIRINLSPKMLVLNSPSNPVGNVASAHELELVADWARKKGLYVLSDEIYSLVTHDEYTHRSIAEYYPEKTIIFGGLSKHLSLGGWRLGMAILPKGDIGISLSNSFQAIAGCVWSCVPAPIQYTAVFAYSGNEEIEAYIKTCTAIHQIRTHYIYHSLIDMGFDIPKPSGGFYLYPSFRKWKDTLNEMGIFSCTDLSTYLLNIYGIATLPGSAFGDDPKNLALRLSTSFLDMETDEQAAQIIKAYELNDNPDSFIHNYHPRIGLFLKKISEFFSELN